MSSGVCIKQLVQVMTTNYPLTVRGKNQMRYTNDSQIKNVSEVKAFASYLVNDLGVNIHPDNDFSEYVCCATGEPTFSDEEANIGNRLMEECFDVCQKEGVDIYELLLPILMNCVSNGVCNE